RDLEDRSRPPALRFGRDDRHAGPKNSGDRLGTVRKVEHALTFAFLGIDDDAMRVELLAHRISDHERKARSVYYRGHRFVDLSIGFFEGNGCGNSLLNGCD